jgi:hypothetical protein
MTLSGRLVTAASEAIGIEEVLDARIASAGRRPSASRKMASFTPWSSTTASIMRSAGTMLSARSTRPRTSSGERSAPLAARRSRLFCIASRPRSTAPGVAS